MANQRLRVIGGRYRGQIIRFHPNHDLRPTPDRVRETVFNWLCPLILGARCLDLFSGSGAMGIEALSRGANEVVFVESHYPSVQKIRQNLAAFKLCETEKYCVIHSTAQQYLKGDPKPFDIIFVDPPYRKDLLKPICYQLQSGGWLKKMTHLYLEGEYALQQQQLQPHWMIAKSKKMGRVFCHLVSTTISQ